jgi:hypothetical protein
MLRGKVERTNEIGELHGCPKHASGGLSNGCGKVYNLLGAIGRRR